MSGEAMGSRRRESRAVTIVIAAGLTAAVGWIASSLWTGSRADVLAGPSHPAEYVEAGYVASTLRESLHTELDAARSPVEADSESNVDVDGADEPSDLQLGGRVVDANGVPVPDAWVSLTRADTGEQVGAGTDSDGAFDVSGLVGGRYELRVDALDRPSLVRTDYWIDAENLRADERFVLAAGAEVFGAVLPWRGDGGGVFEVVFEHREGPERRALVDSAGHYRLSDLTPGAHRVRLERHEATERAWLAARHHEPTTFDVVLSADTATRHDVFDAVAAMSRVRGRLRGHPRPESTTVRARSAAQQDSALEATPAIDGAFALDGLVPGAWQVEVCAADGEVLVRREFQVSAPTDATDEVELRIDLLGSGG